MRRGRQQYSQPLGPLKRDLPEVFLRLCHHCLFLNESDQEIEQCVRCEKCFGPKPITHSYHFQDTDGEPDTAPSLEQALDHLEEELDPPHEKSSVRKPLVNGLNVKW